ncbi:TPA: hypothetical protein RTG46_000946 [Campylobacter jejuni]|nr:hypothetical protein C414_000260128 [Campylobacter jejuni subsp. jejuni 414]HDZ5005829.1 hypothetical protein [Campylobacter jejuni]HDZ5012303.1 hypothetical protein [Campylobacter jejuni]HDZ5015978.1 hypothetical protein [Campylobacter jejuni]HDZ5024116.1 hypothetical protein [Campylobacter jejuni]
MVTKITQDQIKDLKQNENIFNEEIERLSTRVLSIYKALQLAKNERSSINTQIKDYEKELEQTMKALERLKQPSLFNIEGIKDDNSKTI